MLSMPYSQPKIRKPPKKLKRSMVVEVEAHERTIYCREYYIICKGCNRSVSRASFGPCPLYCLECRPPKSQTTSESKQVKKLPRPVLVETDNGIQRGRKKAASRWRQRNKQLANFFILISFLFSCFTLNLKQILRYQSFFREVLHL